MKHRLFFMAITFVAMAMISCSRENKAERLVRNFMKENMTTSDLSQQRFSRLASTDPASPLKQLQNSELKPGESKVTRRPSSTLKLPPRCCCA